MNNVINGNKSLAFYPWIFLFLTLLYLQPAFAIPTTPTSDFIDNKDGTVTHKTTGLMWMRCAMGQTWTGSTCSGEASTYAYDQAVPLTSTFASHNDWRLPNIAELQSIVELENYRPAINTTLFPNAPNNSFWSSSPSVDYAGEAWSVYFFSGVADFSLYDNNFAVRLVRANQSLGIDISTPNTDFSNNQNGTVTHKRTGLMWQRCSVGQTWDQATSTCTGSATTYTYDSAIALKSTFAGYSDWRVPNANELTSIIKYDAANPAINQNQFPHTPSNVFWSSLLYAGSAGDAWGIGFNYGYVGIASHSYSFAVRLVRGKWYSDYPGKHVLPFLSFPLECADTLCNFPYRNGAYTPKSINSVLDHHMDSPYGKDGVVLAFTGEEGRGKAKKQGCYPKVGGGVFSVKGLYKGTNDGCLPNQGLNYDNHPGYDYYAKMGMPVKAAARGKVVNIVNKLTGTYGRCVPRGIDKTGGCDAWGYIGIDHGNGYITQYGHLTDVTVHEGDSVKKGDKSACLDKHLLHTRTIKAFITSFQSIHTFTSRC